MSHVVVLATGGTIASSRGDDGASVARRGADDLVAGFDLQDISVESRDVFRLGSYLLEHSHLRLLAEAVAEELGRPDVDGVVVTHGTDTMEETAYLLDLVHDSSKPVVLTGAQRPADAPDTDGPANLRDAIRVAGSPAVAGYGVLICFAGQVYAARGTRKVHTVASAPFRTLDGGSLGRVDGSGVRCTVRPLRAPVLAVPTSAFDTARVDVISVYPGADARLARAAVDAGAAGIVIAGSGVGNANHTIRDWTTEAVADGVVVGLSSRVLEGPVVPFYGNGGGADLVRAGAIPLRSLPLFQARILVALLCSTGSAVTGERMDPYL